MDEVGERVAIVGSRDYPRLDLVIRCVRSLAPGTLVISGGARGVDLQAERIARIHGLPLMVFRARWNIYGRRAGFIRNARIVETCTRVVAFWDGSSSGTAHTIQIARLVTPRPLLVVGPDGKRMRQWEIPPNHSASTSP
jgi:hypothetical protein